MKVVIPIKAVGKERPRYSSNTKTFFTPKKTKDFEAEIGAHTKFHMISNNIKQIDGPVTVEIIVKIKTPASWTKRRTASALEGDFNHLITKDVDNLAKSILDGLQGVLYDNDKQVVKCSVEKLYYKVDLIEIVAYPTIGYKLDVDPRFNNFGFK